MRSDSLDLAAIRSLLAARLGLDAESVGHSFFESVRRRILEESGDTDLQLFLRSAEAGGAAWEALVDHAVVAETWFFRDHAPFEQIAEGVRVRWKNSKGAPVRILSCPCSTGEEPYSVAIALAEAGLPPGAFRIDAADVNARALRAAQTGIFRPRSFRRNDWAIRDRYFDHDQSARVWRLNGGVRAAVQFRLVNLVSLEGLQDWMRYDVVLCRNLLIYLHAEARAGVMAAVRRLLVDDGLLVVGHAEPAIVRAHGFVGEGDSAAFAFRKLPPSAENRTPEKSKVRIRPGGDEARHNRAVPSFGAPHAGSSRIVVPRDDGASTLDRIREIGDRGRVEEAMRACRDYVRRIPDSADGYFLLGVLESAAGRPQAAEDAFRRALYLEHDHADALMHLALTYEARGDAAGAARLRERGRPRKRVLEKGLR